MKVITGGRVSGKTYQAIKYASENWLYILVRNRQEATEIFQMANKFGFGIPYPVTVEELKRGDGKGTSLERNGIIVDNALSVLQELLPVRINMATVEMEAESDEL